MQFTLQGNSPEFRFPASPKYGDFGYEFTLLQQELEGPPLEGEKDTLRSQVVRDCP